MQEREATSFAIPLRRFFVVLGKSAKALYQQKLQFEAGYASGFKDVGSTRTLAVKTTIVPRTSLPGSQGKPSAALKQVYDISIQQMPPQTLSKTLFQPRWKLRQATMRYSS